ncbi:MAG TPA: FAD:protein FMN transferase [Steroidobacteraceae bacterium]|nr:FAD:protein FMN transferase [Steroidobacteraceae bacterium]
MREPTTQSLVIEERAGGLLAMQFRAMASPCELLLPASDRAEAMTLGRIVAEEAWRVEQKFSRYRDDSVVAWIHRNGGTEITVDEETADLIDFAHQCYELSDGLFDITSGLFRRAWTFDGSDRVPEPDVVGTLLPHVGFDRVRWHRPHLTLPAGMEIDFGGIGKEYAVDRAFEKISVHLSLPFLINFGGDLRANRPSARGPWQIGIERPDTDRQAGRVLELERGALATSGDSHRFLLRDGVRFGHVLNPRTGWPISGAPRSVTVAASTCTEAGMLATLALLQGPKAEEFLQQQGVRYWIF